MNGHSAEDPEDALQSPARMHARESSSATSMVGALLWLALCLCSACLLPDVHLAKQSTAGASGSTKRGGVDAAGTTGSGGMVAGDTPADSGMPGGPEQHDAGPRDAGNPSAAGGGEDAADASAPDASKPIDSAQCAIDNGGCDMSPRAACTDQPNGGVKCDCPAGYAGRGVGSNGCTDIDECTTDNGGCSISPMAMCTNRMGMLPKCTCPSGYTGSGVGSAGCTSEPPALAPDQIACLQTAADDCEKCACMNCTGTETACRLGTDTDANKLCNSVLVCERINNCSGTPCYCGAANCLTAPNGPCLKEVETAAGTTDPVTINQRQMDQTMPLGRAWFADACRLMQCQNSCR